MNEQVNAATPATPVDAAEAARRDALKQGAAKKQEGFVQVDADKNGVDEQPKSNDNGR